MLPMLRLAPHKPADRSRVVRPRGRPPLPASDVALRRARIIDAAARMFFAHGFAETTLDAVGREAGVTKRTIYELVGDKSALFRAACDKLRVRGPNFEFDIPVSGRSVREVLKHMARKLADHSLNKELIALERAVMIESTRCPEIVSEVVAGGKLGLINAIAAIFEALVAHEMIGTIPSAFRAADIFYDVTVGARGFRAALGHPDESPSDADLEERIDMFFYGYLERVTA